MAKQQGAEDAHDHKKGWLGGNELAFSLLCGACLLSGFLLQQLGPFPDSVSRGFYIAAYVFGGFFALREAATSNSARTHAGQEALRGSRSCRP